MPRSCGDAGRKNGPGVPDVDPAVEPLGSSYGGFPGSSSGVNAIHSAVCRYVARINSGMAGWLAVGV